MPFGFSGSKSTPAPDSSGLATPELLGEVTVPSGDLILIDFGLLHIWSGEEQPVLRPTDAPDDAVQRANSSVDISIDGPDASELAALFDLAARRGTYIFDQPPEHAAEMVDRVATAARDGGLDATAIVLDRRLPHAERLRRLLDADPTGTEVPFHGIWAVAVRGLPRDRTLPVYGLRMPAIGPDVDRWWSVWVECAEGDVSESIQAGYVLVDEARLMWADPLALPYFRTDARPEDPVDVVFWGRDAVEVARRHGAAAIDEGTGQRVFGWLSLPLHDARARVDELERLKTDEQLMFVVDGRPHNDMWRLLAQARSASTGSGTVRLEAGTVCGFFTSWGDGAFPVYRDVDSSGRLLRVRVELGAPEIVDRTRKFEELWFGSFAKLALVSARVARDGRPVRWLYREAPDRPDDSGWRIFAGDEPPAYNDDPANIEVMVLRDILDLDPSLEEVLREDAPCRYERTASGEFRRVDV